jgi:hypothetical protein
MSLAIFDLHIQGLQTSSQSTLEFLCEIFLEALSCNLFGFTFFHSSRSHVVTFIMVLNLLEMLKTKSSHIFDSITTTHLPQIYVHKGTIATNHIFSLHENDF